LWPKLPPNKAKGQAFVNEATWAFLRDGTAEDPSGSGSAVSADERAKLEEVREWWAVKNGGAASAPPAPKRQKLKLLKDIQAGEFCDLDVKVSTGTQTRYLDSLAWITS
jgi:hypothetical protein